MNKNLVQQVTASQIRKDLPRLESGDTVRVMVTIREGNKERQQAFEGVVISIRGKGASKSFVVRKDSAGIGVERNFLLNSPIISSIKVLKHGKVRRKNLYYLRTRAGKSARLAQVIKDDSNLYPEIQIIDTPKEESTPVKEAKVEETKVDNPVEESKLEETTPITEENKEETKAE